MNSTLVLLMSSLLMGTSFLQKVAENGRAENGTRLTNKEVRTYLSNNPFFGGGGSERGGVPGGSRDDGGCWHTSPQIHGEDQRRLVDGYPVGRPGFGNGGGNGLPPQRGGPYPGVVPGRGNPVGDPRDQLDNCRVRIGLQYSSCFSKFDDFDDKFDELRHHVQGLPRGTDGFGNSPCSTLQLLAKVKSTPIYDRCQGNQYLLRTPYHMYNIKGELRYIVQDPPHLEQCYLEASCSIPTQLCRTHGYVPSERRPSSCESRQCHHTLLSWDPTSPNAGTFFDTFEYACCCNCDVLPQPARAQIVG